MNDYILGQPEPPQTRLGARFAVFGLVVVIVVGLLTTRLFTSRSSVAAITQVWHKTH